MCVCSDLLKLPKLKGCQNIIPNISNIRESQHNDTYHSLFSYKNDHNLHLFLPLHIMYCIYILPSLPHINHPTDLEIEPMKHSEAGVSASNEPMPWYCTSALPSYWVSQAFIGNLLTNVVFYAAETHHTTGPSPKVQMLQNSCLPPKYDSCLLP